MIILLKCREIHAKSVVKSIFFFVSIVTHFRNNIHYNNYKSQQIQKGFLAEQSPNKHGVSQVLGYAPSCGRVNMCMSDIPAGSRKWSNEHGSIAHSVV